MKILLQRVKTAKVTIEEKLFSEIGLGLLLYVGFGKGDTEDIAKALVKKVLSFRIFPDHEGKMNKSLLDRGGELLVVSQFTLYANTKNGNRPSFEKALEPTLAKARYEETLDFFTTALGKERVKTGLFGAHMVVTSENDGPINFMLEL